MTEKNAPGVFLAWSGIVESITSGFEDFKPLDQWISVFEELMQRFKGFPSEEIALRVTTNIFMALLYRRPQHSEIDAWTEKALSLAEASSNIGEKLRTLNRLAQYFMFMGDFRKTMLVMNSSQQLAQSRDAPPIALILSKYVEATYYGQIRLHEKCLKSVFDGLEISRTTGMHGADYGLLGAGVSSALMANDPTTAGKLLEEMASHSREQRPWMVPLRERLRSKFLESVERLGQYSQQTGQLEKAVECYKKGLELDDLAEEFYQGLMACYLNLDQKAKALSVYNRCKKVLFATLGIEPSPKTEVLRKSIKQGGPSNPLD